MVVSSKRSMEVMIGESMGKLASIIPHTATNRNKTIAKKQLSESEPTDEPSNSARISPDFFAVVKSNHLLTAHEADVNNMFEMALTTSAQMVVVPCLLHHVIHPPELESNMDEIRAIRQQESSPGYALGRSYLDDCTLNQNSENVAETQVSESWRYKICEWSFEVVDHFGFDREVVSIALNYLDRYVAKCVSDAEIVCRRVFQLVSVAALYLAIKLHGETDALQGPRRKLKIKAFVELSRGIFSVEAIEKMELAMLNTLYWLVNPPTPVRCVAAILALLPKWSVCEERKEPIMTVACNLFDQARYLTELSVCVSCFTFQFKPLVLAYACIMCAIDEEPGYFFPFDVRVEFVRRVEVAANLLPSSTEVQEAYLLLARHFGPLLRQTHKR